jgi:hypothetical protein
MTSKHNHGVQLSSLKRVQFRMSVDSKDGGLYWPRQGTGWYWSTEIAAARRCLHAEVAVLDMWVARRKCDCRPFDWVDELYDLRRRLGPDTGGQPLKFALNSLYGKLAQRARAIPRPQYQPG